MKSLNTIIYSRLFFVGLTARIAMIILVKPMPVDFWYAPFMVNSVHNLSVFPWQTWLSQGGTLEAFPYGYAMWLVFLPGALLSLVGLPATLGYDLTLLMADFAVLLGLQILLADKTRILLWAYWLSPVIFIANYGLGLNDIVPSAILVFTLIALKVQRYQLCGILAATAVSAKLSMIVALPFLILYLYNNHRFRKYIGQFFVGLSSASVVWILPHLASADARKMLFETPQINKVMELVFTLGHGATIHIVPLVYLIFLYLFWRLRRINFDLLLASIAISFLLIILLTAASPGWFVWAMPFLAVYTAQSGRKAGAIIGLFSALYIATVPIRSPISFTESFNVVVGFDQAPSLSAGLNSVSVLHTLLFVIGVILMLRVWRQSFQESDFFRFSRKSFVIGIAGDSGSGKDTLVDSLISIFGRHSCTTLSGDDYHVWDRRSTIWGAISHLNPAANELERMAKDVINLVNNRNVFVRHYDHRIGRFTSPLCIKPNNFIFVSGLHALYLQLTRSAYDLKIYLDIDEDLRRFFKLRRDTLQRGHSSEKVLESIARRTPDALRFVQPQKHHADLLIRLEPVEPIVLKPFNAEHEPVLKVTFESYKSDNYLSLHRVFVGVLGLNVTYTTETDGTGVRMTVDGHPTIEDIELAAKSVFQRELEFLDESPKWRNGVEGVIQLIMLSEISRALTKRII